jgi:hypothetical protein
MYLIKTNPVGDTIWTRTYGGPGGDAGLSVQETSDGGYIISGWCDYFGPNGSDVYVVKTKPDGLVSVQGVRIIVPTLSTLEQNYPNPFNPSTTIRYGLPVRSHVTLTVFNTLGQQVATLVNGEIEAGFHEAVFDASGLASGVYLYRLQAGDFVQIRRLVLVR